jgi:hypothetical protein
MRFNEDYEGIVRKFLLSFLQMDAETNKKKNSKECKLFALNLHLYCNASISIFLMEFLAKPYKYLIVKNVFIVRISYSEELQLKRISAQKAVQKKDSSMSIYRNP